MALLSPLTLGPITLPHRVLMGPMTRARATQPGDVPGPMNARYYAQRASAGLIVSEATQVDPQGKGYAFTPGIYSDEQQDGWKRVSDAVHEAGGRIHAQLWHVGRVSHASFHGGAAPVSASAKNAEAMIFLGGEQPYAPTSTPRALSTDEIADVVGMFRRGAEIAKAAGFDGVELHGANGYLVHQFLCESSNDRTDGYGGSIDGRARFAIEVLTAICEVWDADRVGLRVSPGQGVAGCMEDDPVATYEHLMDACNDLGLAYVDVIEFFGPPTKRPEGPEGVHRAIRERFEGRYFAGGGYDQPRAEAAVARGDCDAVFFAKPFISNPDLPARFERGADLAKWDKSTFYGGAEQGYVDYPRYDAGDEHRRDP
ncbi:MAG: alkene reductase [Polyangiaceae bacterium]